MKWCKAIALKQPLRGVRLLQAAVDNGGQATPEEKHKLEQAAYERGLVDGERRLSEQLVRQRAEVLELQNGVLASLRQAVPQVVKQTEAALIELAFEVAKKLFCDLPISAEMTEAAVRSALEQVGDTTEFDVYLHAEDLVLLQQCNAPERLSGPSHPSLHFHASPEVTRGGCVVKTRFGTIDARRETRLKLIRQSLPS